MATHERIDELINKILNQNELTQEQLVHELRTLRLHVREMEFFIIKNLGEVEDGNKFR